MITDSRDLLTELETSLTIEKINLGLTSMTIEKVETSSMIWKNSRFR